MLWKYFENRITDNNPAIVWDDDTVTYAELLTRASLLADQMKAMGVGPGCVVLIYLGNVPAFLVTLLASSKLGCAFAPLDLQLKECKVQGNLVVSETVVSETKVTFCGNLIQVNRLGDIETTKLSNPMKPLVDNSIACMQFTSGSTGQPKAILLTHEACYYRPYSVKQALGLTHQDRTLCILPLSHPHGAECLALPTLIAGGILFLKSPEFSYPLYILQELERFKITFFSSIPTFYDLAVKLESVDVKIDVKHFFCGSASLSEATARAFHEKYGIAIKQGYGLAELALICVNHHDNESIVYRSVGRPIEGIEWRIQQGELLVRSKGVFSGYLNDKTASEKKLKNGWLYTGDIVSIDEHGLFYIVGRQEDFVKIRGFKVSALEVEAELIALSWVKECLVQPTQDEQLIAYVVPSAWEKTEEVMRSNLINYLRKRLADYKIPAYWAFREELPKTSLGKIRKL